MPRKKAGGSDNASGGLKDIPLRPNAGRVRAVDVTEIAPNPRNLREGDLWESAEERDETVASMKAVGLIQALLVCTREIFLEQYPQHADDLGTATYIVMAGHRRLEAAQLAGLDAVRVDVQNEMIKDLDLLMLEENLKRRTLNLFQEGEGYRRLEAKGSSHAQIAAQVGKSKSTITKRIRLLELPQQARRAILDKELGVDAAYNLLVALDGEIDRFMDAAQIMQSQQLLPQDAVNALYGGSARTDSPTTPPAGAGTAATTDRARPDTKTVLAEPKTATPVSAPTVPASRAESDVSELASGETSVSDSDEAVSGNDAQPQDSQDAEASERAGRAQGNAARNDYCQHLVKNHENPASDPRSVRIATAALMHASSAALARAHSWMKQSDVIDAGAMAPGSYRDAVLMHGDAARITRLAYAVALAEDELRASNRSRQWDYRDRAHLRHLTDTGYELTEWERRHLG